MKNRLKDLGVGLVALVASACATGGATQGGMERELYKGENFHYEIALDEFSSDGICERRELKLKAKSGTLPWNVVSYVWAMDYHCNDEFDIVRFRNDRDRALDGFILRQDMLNALYQVRYSRE